MMDRSLQYQLYLRQAQRVTVKKQFIGSCDKDLALFLNKRTPLQLAELTTPAEKYLQAYGRSLTETRNDSRRASRDGMVKGQGRNHFLGQIRKSDALGITSWVNGEGLH